MKNQWLRQVKILMCRHHWQAVYTGDDPKKQYYCDKCSSSRGPGGLARPWINSNDRQGEPVPMRWRWESVLGVHNSGWFLMGTLAIWALRRHYRDEIRPYAARRNFDREMVRAAAHRALERVFDDAWPEEK